MANLRTEETEQKYREYQQDPRFKNECNLCVAPAKKEFKYWKIVENIFPWDRISKVQDMMVPQRHITYEELSETEKKEFGEIKLGYIEDNYELMAEATNKIKTIPSHFHVHLIITKDKV